MRSECECCQPRPRLWCAVYTASSNPALIIKREYWPTLDTRAAIRQNHAAEFNILSSSEMLLMYDVSSRFWLLKAWVCSPNWCRGLCAPGKGEGRKVIHGHHEGETHSLANWAEVWSIINHTEIAHGSKIHSLMSLMTYKTTKNKHSQSVDTPFLGFDGPLLSILLIKTFSYLSRICASYFAVKLYRSNISWSIDLSYLIFSISRM